MNTIHQSITNNQNNSSAAAPPASSLAHPPAHHRRRSTQRVFLKDRPESIYQMQISQIEKLNEQLAAYKNQYHIATGSNIEQDSGRQKRQSFNAKAADSNQTVKNILTAGEAYRSELLAAQQRKAHEARQSAAIQRHLEAFTRERETLAAEVCNEKSKNSIMEQELFMLKDTFGKYKNKTDAEKHDYAYQIKNLRANINGLETVIKELTPKANLLPFYEQKVNQSEYKMGLMNQEILQLCGDLRYFQQKSNYFVTNFTVLNENFNNLYNTNLNLTNQLKETKTISAKMESTIKSLEEQCKRLNTKIFEQSEQKNKLIGQLNSQIVLLSQRIKGEHNAADRTQKVNEKLNTSLDQCKRISRELQTKNQYISRELDSKSTIIHGQKVLNEQFQSSLKEMQQSLAKKEEFWKQVLATQIVKLSNQSREKALSISSELIKSSENAKVLSVGLAKSEQQLEMLKQKATKLEKQLDMAQYQIQQKERTNNTLKDHYEQAKIEIVSLKNCIKDYENRLNVALSVQEQINSNSQANLAQKSAKIKQLQAKIEHLSHQNVKLQLHVKDLLEEISKFTEISNILRSQLQISREDVINLEEQLKGEIKKSSWLMDQNNLKEQIIAKYNIVSEEMKAKITNYYNDINELNQKNLFLEESLSQAKLLAQEKQAQIMLKAKLLAQNSQKSLQQQKQAQKLSTTIANLSNEKALLLQKNEELGLQASILLQKLAKSQNSLVNLQIALKKTVESLKKTHQDSAQQLKEQHRIKLQESERISQNELNNKGLIIDVCKKQIEDSISKLNAEIDEKNKLQNKLIQLTSSFEKLQHQNITLKSQILTQKAEIQQLIKQRQQMAHIIQIKTDNIQRLKLSLIQLDQTYRNSIEEGSKKNQQNKNIMITQWKSEKQTLNSKIEEGNSHLQRKIQLQQQLKNSSIINHNLIIHLQSEKIRVQNLALENELLRKSIKQLQQTFISKIQQEIQLKFQFEQKQFDRLNNQIQKLTQERNALKVDNEDLYKKLTEVRKMAETLSTDKEKLQEALKMNIQGSRAELQFLKKANVQLQVHLQNLVQANHTDNRIKHDLSQSLSAIQIRNSFLEEYMKRTQVQIASIQSIFDQLKEERDLLIKKYIVLTNEIYKLNSKNITLDRELDSFAQYFSKVSALHTQINKHLFNITHLSQPTTTVRFLSAVVPKKMEESFVEKIN